MLVSAEMNELTDWLNPLLSEMLFCKSLRVVRTLFHWKNFVYAGGVAGKVESKWHGAVCVLNLSKNFSEIMVFEVDC
jgi:hypothetical protein